MTPQPTGCLVFKTESGSIPCGPGEVSIDLVDEGLSGLDPELVRNAAAGVLHFFREQGRESVTVGEFSEALIRVLRGFGLDVEAGGNAVTVVPLVVSDLLQLCHESGRGFELAFFPLLRQEVAAQLLRSPRVLQFTGLRSCVKKLAGARRWSQRCEELSDQIVEYLRLCLSENRSASECALVVV